MSQKLVDKYTISELLAFKNILESKMNQLNFQRERAIFIDTDLYERLQIKLEKIVNRINQLVESL